jgi:hypothetical protein
MPSRASALSPAGSARRNAPSEVATSRHDPMPSASISPAVGRRCRGAYEPERPPGSAGDVRHPDLRPVGRADPQVTGDHRPPLPLSVLGTRYNDQCDIADNICGDSIRCQPPFIPARSTFNCGSSAC